MAIEITAPLRDEPLVLNNGYASFTAQVFFEELDRVINEDSTNIVTLTLSVSALEPSYTLIDSTDSPYSASDNDYLLCEMSAGSITVVLPSEGRLHISRDGASNTLTLEGTVQGEIDPTIDNDGDGPSLAFIGTEWRYV